MADYIVPYYQLDIRPTMQMQVDSDFAKGVINHHQAIRRRELIDRLTKLIDDFYDQYDLAKYTDYHYRENDVNDNPPEEAYTNESKAPRIREVIKRIQCGIRISHSIREMHTESRKEKCRLTAFTNSLHVFDDDSSELMSNLLNDIEMLVKRPLSPEDIRAVEKVLKRLRNTGGRK